MIYQKYQKVARTATAVAAMLIVAACDSGASTGDSANVYDQATLDAANVYVEGKSGTWGDIVYGSEDAPITVIEYGSLTCGACGAFSRDTFPKLEEEFINTGKVKFIFRNLVRDSVDMVASTVARCRDPETSKRLNHLFFDRQSDWLGAQDRNAALAKLARRAVNMSRTEFDRCASDRDLMKNLTEMTNSGARDFNVRSTPTIFINGAGLADFRWDNFKKVLEEQAP